ncbi:MAG: hypothetical protein JWL64_1204 [Frankiales bacterium]|nr:hypothetical protein [Frankiales bacterium]
MSGAPPPLLTPTGVTGRRQTRFATGAVLVVGGLVTVAATAVLGWSGLWSGLAAVVVVLAFFYAGLTPLKLTGVMGEKAAVGLMVLLLNYTFRLVAVLVVLVALGRSGRLDGDALGLTIIASALAWMLGQAWIGLRHHDPLDLPDFGATDEDPRTLGS